MMQNRFHPTSIVALTILLTSLLPGAASAEIKIAQIKHDGPVSFEKEILPILRRNCLACHNASDAESDLILETPQSIIKGGGEGASVIPGKGAESLLLKVAAHQDDPIMPPEDNDVGAKNLTPEQLGLLKLWIDQGAKGSVSGSLGPVSWQAMPSNVRPIYALAVSPDGTYVAAARANQIFLYEARSKRLVGKLDDPALVKSGVYSQPGSAHLDLVQSLAFSPDGQYLASGGYRTVKLWRRPQNPKTAEFGGLEGATTGVTTSADGKWAAVGEDNGKVRVFDLASGKVTRTIQAHTGPVRGVAFSLSGEMLATGGDDKFAKVWTLADGKEKAALETPSTVRAVAFVVEDKQVATGGDDKIIRTWLIEQPVEEKPADAKPEGEKPAEGDKPAEEAKPKPVKEIPGHGGAINVLVAIVPAGQTSATQLLSGGEAGTVRHWDAVKGTAVRAMTHGGPVKDIAISPNGQRFVSASGNGSGKLWNATNGQQLAEVKGSHRVTRQVNDLGLSIRLAQLRVQNAKKDLDEANKRLKSEQDNSKKADEAKTKAEADFKTKMEAAKKPTEALAAAEAEKKTTMEALTKAQDEQTKAQEEVTKAEEALKKVQEEASKAEGDDAKKAAQEKVKQADEKLKAVRETKKKADQEFNNANNKFKQAENKVKQATAPAQKANDEKNAAERAMQAAVRSVERAKESVKKATDAVPVVDTAHKSEEAALKKFQEQQQAAQKSMGEAAKPMAAVAFTSDNGRFAIAGADGFVHIFCSEKGAPLEVYEGAASPILGLVPVAGDALLTVGENKKLTVWDTAAAWKLERTIGSPESAELADRVTSLDFSPDSKVLATGGGEPSRSGELKLWNVENGSLVREFKDAHSDSIFGMEFSPDGKYIATSGADRFMKVFDVQSGKFVKSFEGHTHHVLGVSWRADGRLLATCGADSVVKVWNFQTGDQLKTISGYKKEVTSIDYMVYNNSFDSMVTSSGDRTVGIKTSAGGNQGNYSGPKDFMYVVRSSADGKTVAAGGQDSVVHVWDERRQVIATFAAPEPEPEPTDEQASK